MNTFKKTLALVLTLAMVLSVVVVPASAATTYTDVTAERWFAESVLRWSDAAASIDEVGEAVPVLNGYPDGSFKPGNPITRAETAKTLAGVFGLVELAENKFTDVPEGKWYTESVLAAAKVGLVEGYPDGSYKPGENIERQAAFLILQRALLLNEKGNPETLKKFADKSVLDEEGNETNLTQKWAAEGVAAMVEAGYVMGDTNNELNAQDPITRAELTKVLDRMIGLYVDAEGNIIATSNSDDVIKSHLVVVNANCVEDVTVVPTEKGVKVIVGDEEVELIPEDGKTAEVVIVGRESRVVEDEIQIEGADEDDQAQFVDKEEEPTDPSTEPTEGTEPTEPEHECKFEKVTECENCAVSYTELWECECGATKTEEIAAHTHTFVEGECECCGMAYEDAMKFDLKVESNDEYVEMYVTNDYAANITVTPGKVTAASVKLYAAMQDVDSLGVADKREHSVEINTGLEGDPELKTWLSNAFDFEGAELDVTIIDTDETEYETNYIFNAAELDEDGVATIKAEPADVENTREAWQVLTSHVETSTQEADDSSITIGNASYLRVVDEKLGFEKQVDKDLVLDNFNNLDALESEIRNTVRVYEAEGETAVEAFLTAGTQLAVGSSIATLTDDCLITIDNIDEDLVAGILSELRDAEGGYAMASSLVKLINNLIGSIDEADYTAEVVIAFAEHVELGTKFYFSVSALNEDGNGTTTVDMEVYEDYSFEINVPMNTIDASEVNLYVEMNNVASLGVNGTKKHEITLNDVVTATPDLGVWLSNVATFEDTTIVVSVMGPKALGEWNQVVTTWELKGDTDANCPTIIGTPVPTDEWYEDGVEGARDAFHSITNHLTITSQESDDSFIKLTASPDRFSFVTYMPAPTPIASYNGQELYFEEGIKELKLDNFSNLGDLKQTIKDSVCVKENPNWYPMDKSVTVNLGDGTALAVGSSVATLDGYTCSITINGIEIPEEYNLDVIREAANGSTETLAKLLVNMVNEVIGAADVSGEISVDIMFSEIY